jgi:hypothetical protein
MIVSQTSAARPSVSVGTTGAAWPTPAEGYLAELATVISYSISESISESAGPEGSGSQSSPSFPQAPNTGERVPRLGSAKPIACGATAGSDLDAVAGSGIMDRREDVTVQRRLRRPVSPTDQW